MKSVFLENNEEMIICAILDSLAKRLKLPRDLNGGEIVVEWISVKDRLPIEVKSK